jgi:hypothetical protein
VIFSEEPSRPEVIIMRTLVRSLPALLGILATAALSADVNDKKDRRLTADLYFQWEDAQKKEARMVRVPDEPHGIRNHPSHYIAPRSSSFRTGSKNTKDTRRLRVIDAQSGGW